ncbi:EMILIN-1-like [Littorina saxatilis]|uniref:C1q domain-containing protein n=1 Tax=Littorina saxatilis TaxID=31220 RepID=A0AAN9B9S4_9CAEN
MQTLQAMLILLTASCASSLLIDYRLANRVTTLEDQVKGLLDARNLRSGFLAQFSEFNVTTGSGHYKFDQVVFNDGNDYDSATGVYTAPCTGIYLISAKIFIAPLPKTRPVFDIRLDATNQGKVSTTILDRISFGMSAINETGPASASTTVTVRLEAGNRLWVESMNVYSLKGKFRTFFSGVLLSADIVID